MGLEFLSEEERNPTNVPTPVTQKSECEAERKEQERINKENN